MLNISSNENHQSFCNNCFRDVMFPTDLDIILILNLIALPKTVQVYDFVHVADTLCALCIVQFLNERPGTMSLFILKHF